MENNIEQIPSAEYVLGKVFTGELNNPRYREVIQAMEEYASLKVEEERKKHNNIEAHLNQVNKLTKALEWKDRIISDLKEKINDKSPF